jgi:hypothetical protein
VRFFETITNLSTSILVPPRSSRTLRLPLEENTQAFARYLNCFRLALKYQALYFHKTSKSQTRYGAKYKLLSVSNLYRTLTSGRKVKLLSPHCHLKLLLSYLKTPRRLNNKDSKSRLSDQGIDESKKKVYRIWRRAQLFRPVAESAAD